ncbi:hypothetical protein EMIT0P228_40128 [Pseudomonas brassicacearum]
MGRDWGWRSSRRSCRGSMGASNCCLRQKIGRRGSRFGSGYRLPLLPPAIRQPANLRILDKQSTLSKYSRPYSYI